VEDGYVNFRRVIYVEKTMPAMRVWLIRLRFELSSTTLNLPSAFITVYPQQSSSQLGKRLSKQTLLLKAKTFSIHILLSTSLSVQQSKEMSKI
jgi:hypothetical protein